MNRKGFVKIGLSFAVLLAIALILIFVLPVFSIPFTSNVNPTNVNASTTNQILNFTIVNINATGNITQVNITLPAGFGFIAASNTTTASGTIFSSAGQLVSWVNTTETGFVVSGGDTQYFSINVIVPSNASVAYNFNVSTLDTAGVYNSTNVSVTVNDTTYPTWSGQSNVTPLIYSSTPSRFNITWADNVDISTVLIEGNWSNSNASTTPTYGGGIYNYSAVLPAGIWQWKSYANDTRGNMNASSPVIIYIAQAATLATLYLNDTVANITSTYPNSTINVTAVSNVSGLYVQLWRSGTLISNATGTAWNISQWNASNNNFTARVLGNDNYTDSVNVFLWFNVSKGPTSINLFINGTQANWTSTYPNSTLNITAVINVTGLAINIYRNSLSICSGATSCNNTNLWGGGLHNFTAVYDTGENYSASSTNLNATINLAATSVILYLNGTINNITSTYPNSTINATAVANITGANVTIWRNGTSLVSASSTANDIRQWGAYNNYFNASVIADQNYSASSVVFLWWNISKGATTGSISGSNVTLPNTASITPLESNGGDADVNYSFWRDTSFVSLANGTTSFSAYTQSTASTYTYMLNSTAGENWSANSSIYTVVIVVTAAATPTTTTSGSSISGITSTGMVTYINLAVGKANITANYLTTDGKLIAKIARYQDVAIRGLNITVVNNVANIKIMTLKLANLPSSVPYDIDGKVYNYISVDKLNFTDSDIRVVNISFAVNKTWLTNNNISASNITLYRWSNNKWNDLSAVKVSEDDREVFYKVSSPGLSVFVIGTTGGAPIIPETPAACTESWTCGDWSACANSQQTRTCTDANSCGTTAGKPSESQSCTVNRGETTVTAPVQTSILTTVIVIVVAIIACVFIFLQRTKISYYLGKISKKTNNHKKTSYLESLARKTNNVEEEKFTDI